MGQWVINVFLTRKLDVPEVYQIQHELNATAPDFQVSVTTDSYSWIVMGKLEAQ